MRNLFFSHSAQTDFWQPHVVHKTFTTMKVSLQRSYRSKNGHVTFVYKVTGSAADLSAYVDAQGEYYREDETTGDALWFTTRCIGQSGTLIITSNGNIVPDMSAFDQAASIASQFGGNFGQELAKQAAQSILGVGTPSTDSESSNAPSTPKAEKPKAKKKAKKTDELENLED